MDVLPHTLIGMIMSFALMGLLIKVTDWFKLRSGSLKIFEYLILCSGCIGIGLFICNVVLVVAVLMKYQVIPAITKYWRWA